MHLSSKVVGQVFLRSSFHLFFFFCQKYIDVHEKMLGFHENLTVLSVFVFLVKCEVMRGDRMTNFGFTIATMYYSCFVRCTILHQMKYPTCTYTHTLTHEQNIAYPFQVSWLLIKRKWRAKHFRTKSF